jgi:site-specific recombinase XerD
MGTKIGAGLSGGASADQAQAVVPAPVHAHMLRHGCGYALANAGHDTRAIQDWLGHRSIQHTVRYTELSPTRFRDFWR